MTAAVSLPRRCRRRAARSASDRGDHRLLGVISIMVMLRMAVIVRWPRPGDRPNPEPRRRQLVAATRPPTCTKPHFEHRGSASVDVSVGTRSVLSRATHPCVASTLGSFEGIARRVSFGLDDLDPRSDPRVHEPRSVDVCTTLARRRRQRRAVRRDRPHDRRPRPHRCRSSVCSDNPINPELAIAISSLGTDAGAALPVRIDGRGVTASATERRPVAHRDFRHIVVPVREE